MADALRPDGKPFVTDKRNAVPRYVVETDSEGRTVVLNQFTGMSQVVSETEAYEDNDLYVAYNLLRRGEFEAEDARLRTLAEAEGRS